MKISNLEKTLLTLAISVPLVQSVFFKNSAPSTSAERMMGTKEPFIYDLNITPYLGNFPESFGVPAMSGLLGDLIKAYGEDKQNNVITKIGKYFPEISTSTIITYFTLGETILPQILPGTADIKDVPAVLISALAGYTIAKITQKNNFYTKLLKNTK